MLYYHLMLLQMKYYQKFLSSIPILSLLGLWWIGAWFINDPMSLPTPQATAASMLNQWTDKNFWNSVYSSLFNLIVSWVLGCAIILFLIFVSTLGTPARYFIKQITNVFSPLPTFAMAPLLLILFGVTQTTMTLLLIFSMLWINVNFLITAVENSKTKWEKHCRNLQLGPIHSFLKVYIPGMWPDLLTGLKNAWVFSWRTLLAVEITFGNVGSGQGIGINMMMDRMLFNTSDLWASFVFVVIVGYAVSVMFDQMIKRSIDDKI